MFRVDVELIMRAVSALCVRLPHDNDRPDGDVRNFVHVALMDEPDRT